MPRAREPRDTMPSVFCMQSLPGPRRRLLHKAATAVLASAAAAIPFALPSAASQSPKPAEFPSVTSYSLDKQKVTLPSGMEGQTDLLLLSFALEQKKDVESWLPTAQALQHIDFQFRYYQLPVAQRENFVFRWWETSSMRSDESDPVAWHWIVPLFVDRQKLLHDLDIPNEKQVVVLLVDRQGHILWRATGPITDDKRAALMTAAGQH
jgi:hypothetical protein